MAMSRFISKSADKAMPLFYTLKGCIEKNNFQWTAAVEEALQKIKEALHKLPTLGSPITGETLQMYLSASNEAISSVLTVENEGEHKLVYFVSRALQGPELNYPTLERLVLALIYAERHLRHNFQAHQIEILLKPEMSGWLAKWEIELGENDISYRPRTGIKGQALADFLLEIPEEGNSAKERIWAVEEVPANDGSWTMYTNGASSREGSGASLILTSPEGEEVTYALRFDFHTSNNEEEYEALLVGLRLTKQMGAKAVTALTDSRLAANQINGSLRQEIREMERYVRMVRQLIQSFRQFTIKQIPRSENKRVDALSKLASTCFDHLSKKVLVEVLRERSIDERYVNTLTTIGPTWMTPFMEYLQSGILPDDHNEARKIRIKAPSYALINGELYQKRFTTPWLKWVDQARGMEALQEAHAGQAGAHEGARTLTGKVLQMGIYWPTVHQDALGVTRKCGECQSYTPLQANPLVPLQNISSPWSFYQWGIDIVGPFPEAPAKLKEWCASKGINQRFTSVAHPHANGKTEVSNRTIVNGIKKWLGEAKGNRAEEIPAMLWSYRTTPRTSTRETSFSLTYRTEAVLPMEITIGTLRAVNADEESNAQDLRLNLDVLKERREKSEIRQAAYKCVTERYYNKRVKEKLFRIGEYVLRRSEASRTQPQGKMGLVWEGPYKVIEANRNGAYVLETVEGRRIPRTWNARNLKKFFFYGRGDKQRQSPSVMLSIPHF
uniref:RNase H type-1 domain-containing protein n=1 Tax=Lactuca sativa TaxID=4236 RepID=A0A9R1UT32_LACSA|nr:hypothetical protein LSAT_V11C800420460 [Lactuca sativa]